MSSSVCAHRLLLTKEALRDYRYNNTIMKLATQIRDTICDEIDKSCEKHTKYAYKLDEQQQIGTYRVAVQIHHKSRVHVDLIQQLRHFFPDSEIHVDEREIVNGFTVTHQTYIEVDWS
jgi:hypothetical protein